jgi:hypothetical protein
MSGGWYTVNSDLQRVKNVLNQNLRNERIDRTRTECHSENSENSVNSL